jgi:hypothetical protein
MKPAFITCKRALGESLSKLKLNGLVGLVRKFFKKRSELRYSKNFLQFFGVMMGTAGIIVGVYATLTNWIIHPLMKRYRL